MGKKSEIIGLPVFENEHSKTEFLCRSRAAFLHFKFHNDIIKTKKEYEDNPVIDFILKNKNLSVQDFAKSMQDIIYKNSD